MERSCLEKIYYEDDKIEKERTIFGECSYLVEKLIKLDEKLPVLSKGVAIFVPISILDGFEVEIRSKVTLYADSWDYDLKIGDTIEQMKLIWIAGYKTQRIRIHPAIKLAFNFLQPDYLRYMEKPFWNRDVITQVNLVLDYHRTQKRRRKIEIFNIFDLIAFKMAIDDNRFEYENCEFHKLIEQMLTEDIQSGKYTEAYSFDLIEYSGDKYDFRHDQLIIHYLLYHFQHTINSIYWTDYDVYPIKLTNIINVSAFLKSYSRNTLELVATTTDFNGKCAEILYEILVKSMKKIKFSFKLDGEWTYSLDGLTSNTLNKPLAECKIVIETKNSFQFIENFLNWIKFVFGKHSKYFEIQIGNDIINLATIKPFIFYDLNVSRLEFWYVVLDYSLIRMLTKCNYEIVSFGGCGIRNDFNERIDCIGDRSESGKNIFKFFEELHNVEYIQLVWEDHTLGTLLAYVESVMKLNKLIEFKFKNDISILYKQTAEKFGKFQQICVNTDFAQIDAYTSDDVRIDFYELNNNLVPSDRDEFEFYE